VKPVEDRAQTYSLAAPASPQPFAAMQARSEPQNKETPSIQPVVKNTDGDQTGALASGAGEGVTGQTASQAASQTAPQTASQTAVSGQAALASASATTLPTASVAPAASQMSQAAVQTLSDLSLQIQHRAAAGQSQFRIQLTPDSVGKVDVALSIGRDGQTRAQLSFDNPQSAASFAGRLTELGDQLRQAGLDVAPDALSIKINDATLNGKAGDLAAGLALAPGATPADAQNMSQPTFQGSAQAAVQTATQTSATATHPAAATSSQGDSPNANANLSQNLAQNFHQGGQSQSHPQQAARRLRNASRLGAIESDSGLDANLDAALSSLRNGQSSSRLALNLIV
jgi:hypothetical protein